MEVSQPFVARCGSQRLSVSNPNATRSAAWSDTERVERPWEATPFAVRYSLFAADCDQACGSGDFLMTAAHRVARRLAA